MAVKFYILTLNISFSLFPRPLFHPFLCVASKAPHAQGLPNYSQDKCVCVCVCVCVYKPL